jgi:hypothetical protein
MVSGEWRVAAQTIAHPIRHSPFAIRRFVEPSIHHVHGLVENVDVRPPTWYRAFERGPAASSALMADARAVTLDSL